MFYWFRILIVFSLVALSPPSWGGGVRSLLFLPFPGLANNLGAFSITGVTGPGDAIADAALDAGNFATVSWNSSNNSTHYKVAILADDGTTIVCAEETTASTSYSFSSCYLNYSTYYRARVLSGNSDWNLEASNSTYRFWVSPQQENALGSTTPPTPSVVDSNSVELGVKFQSTCDGEIRGVRFYRATANAGGYQVNLWSSGGSNLATKSTTDASLPGWNEVIFNSPVSINKNTTYVASYFTSGGYYAAGSNELASAITNGCLTLLSNAMAGGNGVYRYNATSAFPTDSFNSTNYYVDVIFQPIPTPSVLGITAGLDIQLDDVLASGTSPTVHWSLVPGAGSYDIEIYQDDGTTIECAAANALDPATSLALSSCSLTANTYYKAKILVRDGGGALTGGVSTLYRFHVGNAKVLPAYGSNGRNWNDYVSKMTTSEAIYGQPDVACASTQRWNCIHAGEIRKVVTTKTSCTNLTIVETLSAFDWTCDATDGNAVFYSYGLKSGKGLGDLVQEAGWIANPVTIKESGSDLFTTSGNWWNNTVTPLPDNQSGSVTNLSSAGTIYVLDTTRATTGYNINANKLALVIRPGASLQFVGATNNCNVTTAETGSDHRCMIAVGTQSEVWIEGKIDGQPVAIDFGILTKSMTRSTIHRTTIDKTTRNGINFMTSDGNQVSAVTVINVASGFDVFILQGNYNLIQNFSGSGGLRGINSDGLVGNRLYDIRISNTGASPIDVRSTADVIVHRAHIYNSTGAFLGIWATGFTGSFINLSHMVSGGNPDTDGIRFGDAPRNTFLGVMVLNNDGAASLSLPYESNYTTVVNAVVVGNSYNGLRTSADDLKFVDIVSAHQQISGGYNVTIEAPSANITFSGQLMIGSTVNDCYNDSSGPNQGIADDTCANIGPSDAALTTNIDLSSSFVGRITTDDPANGSDTNGSATYAATNDWLNLSNFYRAWGRNGADWTSANYGPCTTGTCRIWDWRLKSSDTVLKNKLGTAFVAGVNCPAAVHGNQVVTDQMTSPRTFLKYAFEIVNNPRLNWSGNNNGLCESNEACIYAPNLGTYQGEGDFEAGGTCNFQGGVITNVRMYGYPTNGG